MILASQMPAVHIHSGPIETWAAILTVAATAVAGDVLTAGAMRKIGDLDAIRAKAGLGGAVRAVTSSPMFLLGVLCMAVSFFSLLFTVSNVAVSLAAPASASLTFLGNAFAAKIFIKENVNRRRWMAALFVFAGVFLLAK
jgi:multidrug transporter EmrE-like cation transporter